MREYWIVFDAETGAERYRGEGNAGDAAAQVQHLPAGLDLMPVPQAAVIGAEIDLAVVRAGLCAQIDAQAELVRQPFITPGEGQAMTYMQKAVELAAYIANPATPVPMLQAEATALGMSLPDLVQEVCAAQEQWVDVGGRIEGARRCAKRAVNAAGNLKDLKHAALVDWTDVAGG